MTDEPNELDAELIGDESESDEPEFEPEGPFEVRTAVLTKQGMLALLSVRTDVRGGVMVRVDPRQPLPAAQSYDDPEAALRWFRRSLATSQRNGWRVVYDGRPIAG